MSESTLRRCGHDVVGYPSGLRLGVVIPAVRVATIAQVYSWTVLILGQAPPASTTFAATGTEPHPVETCSSSSLSCSGSIRLLGEWRIVCDGMNKNLA